MISIVPYKTTWPDEFLALGTLLRQNLGDLALRIDHIGSTSITGLAAKDIIDIQVTVAQLTPSVEEAFLRAGFKRLLKNTWDHLPPGNDPDPQQWAKWLFRPVSGQRPTNVHVRMLGRANQRYALLFRDYLRAFPAVAEAYGQVKMALVKYHPEDNMDAYYDIKDPVCDIIIGGADNWAASTHWQPGISDG